MNQYTPLKITLLVAVCMLLGSCEYIQNLMGDDEVIDQTMELGIISHIVADAPCRIVLHNKESNIVSISGQKRLVDNLELSTDDGALTISHTKKNFLQKSKLIEIGISAKHLTRLTANMAIELEAPETIKADHFTMLINGGAKFAEIELDLYCQSIQLRVHGNNNIGNYHLSGLTNQAFIVLEGSVNVDALKLITSNCKIKHMSIGSCKVHASTNLKVDTYSSGNTYYQGGAVVSHQCIKVPYLNCTGKVINLD
ncbi:GIN domain-containing protein [Carboxylicivirga sp. M1479]|uniref:GIN domain-containing protein n=1 Tax=Carboxylicivirga sp. M1479 TaxID=2594476 RepID=UPI00117768BC|nr:DUF2807 domain-containing protein [Carboxylicivirga sp. M1479]TRX72020.1 DUF2807 domain-containing protein [Carboxylicivirga sp. M1479]